MEQDAQTAGLRALVLAGSVAYLALYAILVCFRLRYPFELEWLEGASVDHVRVILAGKPLYARPSLDFIPLTYTPGYFYLGAALSTIIGVGFLPLRLISVASSVGLLAVTARLAWRETDDVDAGILAAGLFAAMFGWTSGWLDLARTDSLFLLLAMLAVYILRWHASTRAAIRARPQATRARTARRSRTDPSGSANHAPASVRGDEWRGPRRSATLWPDA